MSHDQPPAERQPDAPEIPALRAPDHPGLTRFFPRESASTTLSLILIPLALGALGGTGLIAAVRWGGGAPTGRASAGREVRSLEQAAQAQAAPIPEADAELLRGALERSGGVRRIHDPSPLDDAPAEEPTWSASFPNQVQTALGAGSGAHAGVPGRTGSNDGGQPAADAPEAAAPSSAGAVSAAPGSGGASPRGSASFSGPGVAAAGAGRVAEPGRPKLELYGGRQGFQLRAQEEQESRGQQRSRSRDQERKGPDLAGFADSVKSALESSQAAAAQAGAFRRAVESLDLRFEGPWQQDPVLRELHDAVSSAKRAGLDAAARMEAYSVTLKTQANALQADLIQAQAFEANPFGTQAPPVTAQQLPPAPDISSQLAEMDRAMDVIQRLKDQVPRGM